MKLITYIFIVVGIILLGIAAARRLIGAPSPFVGVRTLSIIILANSAFLIAIMLKLFEKK